MLIVKKQILSVFEHPIWLTGFGKNKTWRAFLVLPIINALVLLILSNTVSFYIKNPFFLGFVLGFTYLIFELPNSFLKRKLGVKPGEKAKNKAWIFIILDKTDSAFGVILIYYLLGYITLKLALILFLIGSLVHFVVSYFLVVIKIKKAL